MSDLIPILAETCSSYSQKILSLLGKGAQHAALVYEQFFRRGAIHLHHPAFSNARTLLKQICEATDFALPLLHRQLDDGTTGKFLLKTLDHLDTESVIIPMQAGSTLCVSSQVGCRLGCAFCETGRMGLIRHLSVQEITAQLFIAQHVLKQPIRNVVFMGMGEPFDNYENVLQAARVMNDPLGLNIGARHITLSTSGLIEGIYRLAEEEGFTPNLAVSLTAPTNELRNRLMPINKKHSLEDLYVAMEHYCNKKRRQILIAYVLLEGVNDTLEHADQLQSYLKNLPVKINLIPYNPQSRDRYSPPPLEIMEAFAHRLRSNGHQVLIRLTKGKDIMAACGQLGNLGLRKQLIALGKTP
ncbi:MAG: 23S rRNA (adenine(2503)-C(2))-methyltransferase RlmN [Parachlamydiales bacterium]|jgi:23S rRNA (adenine2503-C2)-methyltransferase